MDRATKVTGQAGTAATAAAGTMLQVYWFASSDAVEELDAARQTMNGDADYQGMIAHAGADGLFLRGSVEEMVLVELP